MKANKVPINLALKAVSLLQTEIREQRFINKMIKFQMRKGVKRFEYDGRIVCMIG